MVPAVGSVLELVSSQNKIAEILETVGLPVFGQQNKERRLFKLIKLMRMN
jgi:hypothetical protein